MSTKRDRLKKMRDEHKNVMNEETPAEEYIEAAASYHRETAPEQTAPPELPAGPKTVAEPELSAGPKAVAEPEPPAPAVAPNPIPSQSPVMSAAQQHLQKPQPQQQPVSAQPAPAPTAAPLSYQPAEPVKEEVRPSRSIPYTVANEPGKRISVSLRTENKNWMHRTALRCGLSIQDYMNILIEEAWQREQSSPYLWNEDEPIPERIPSSKTILVAIKLTNVNIERSQRMRAARCMTMTYYMNYLIEEEARREQLQGMRRAVFD